MDTAARLLARGFDDWQSCTRFLLSVAIKSRINCSWRLLCAKTRVLNAVYCGRVSSMLEKKLDDIDTPTLCGLVQGCTSVVSGVIHVGSSCDMQLADFHMSKECCVIQRAASGLRVKQGLMSAAGQPSQQRLICTWSVMQGSTLSFVRSRRTRS